MEGAYYFYDSYDIQKANYEFCLADLACEGQIEIHLGPDIDYQVWFQNIV